MKESKMERIEIMLLTQIKSLFEEIKKMKPEGGFSSPRDIDLVTEVNKKTAIMDYLQDAIRVINPHFEIRD
jgi:hypothetical protein